MGVFFLFSPPVTPNHTLLVPPAQTSSKKQSQVLLEVHSEHFTSILNPESSCTPEAHQQHPKPDGSLVGEKAARGKQTRREVLQKHNLLHVNDHLMGQDTCGGGSLEWWGAPEPEDTWSRGSSWLPREDPRTQAVRSLAHTPRLPSPLQEDSGTHLTHASASSEFHPALRATALGSRGSFPG